MHPAAAWLAIALMLGLAELAAPGVFLVFVALAAAITGLTVLAAPALPLWGQLLSVALWSALTVAIGRRWYREYPVAGGARVNEPAARLIGREVVAEGDFVGGVGRVRVSDGSWPAIGCNASSGEAVRIVAVRQGVLIVEPNRTRHPRAGGDPSSDINPLAPAAMVDSVQDRSPPSRG